MRRSSRRSNTGLASDPSLDVYRLAVERQLHESDLYWTRNNAFLLVQGVLIALYGSSSNVTTEFRVIPVAAGIALAIVWYLVLRRGKMYVARWEAVVSRLEHEAAAAGGQPTIPLLRYFHEAQASESTHRLRFMNLETSQLMKATTVLVAALWIAAGVIAITASSGKATGPPGRPFCRSHQPLCPGGAHGHNH